MITYTTIFTPVENKPDIVERQFKVSGELPPNTRRVQLQVEDGTPFGDYSPAEAATIIEGGYNKGHIRRAAYHIVPAGGS